MKSNYTLLKTSLVMLVLVAFSIGASAATFTAIASGNFSSTSTWSGGTAPGANTSAADNIIINSGLTVNLDQDYTMNNAAASLTLNGTLSGSHNMYMMSGSLTGGLTGMLNVHTLRMGATSTSAFTGSITADNMYNYQTILSITGNTHVNDTMGFYSGVAQLTSGTTLTMGSGATMVFGGGSYSNVSGGTVSLLGNVNLLYTGTGTANMGSELGLTAINNVTLNMMNSTDQMNMAGNLMIAGQLYLQKGRMNMNGHDLTLNGTANTSGNGSLMGDANSSLMIAGQSTGNMGSLMFASGASTVKNLSINGGSGSYINLGSDLNVNGYLALTRGDIYLSGASNLMVTGSDSVHGGSSSSYVATTGSGSLVMNIATSGSSSTNVRMLPIGTQSAYAPVRITNSSSTSGNFSANAHAGIYQNGTTGTDLSTTRSSVNTSWNVESDITTGANVSVESFWSASMEMNSFNRSSVYLSHYTNSSWDGMSAVNTTSNANGMFSVKRSGITSFSPFAVFSGNPSGINEAAKTITFSVYPSPAQNTLTVAIPDFKSVSDVKVYDIIGNQVASYPVNGANTTLDISALTTGVYFLNANNVSQKFVKQ